MSDLPHEHEGVEIARITITRRVTSDDVIDSLSVDGQGGDLALADALEMLRLAEDTIIRDRIRAGKRKP